MGKKDSARSFELGLSGVAVVVFALFFWLGRPEPMENAPDTPERYAVWLDVKARAEAAGLEPGFVFAICVAESSLNPKARAKGDYARGLMQVSRVAWKEVSQRPYSQAFHPQANLEVGTAYLDHLKQFLEERNQFSYPLLAACYRYGPYAVQDAGFRISRLEQPENLIYQQLFAGNEAPVALPKDPSATDSIKPSDA